MKFEKNGIYEFQYAGLDNYNGKRYILLTYEGQNTIDGYGDDHWVFRAELLDFQKSWTASDFSDTIFCFVCGFNIDIDGKETTFPILKQDIKSILQKNYEIGKNYVFPVVAVPGEEIEKEYGKTEVIDYYIVRDQQDFEHRLYTTASYQKGDIVDLTVSDFGSNYLKFADPVRQKIQETFEIGKEYCFEIITEELDKEELYFFTLRDNIEGFIHRFYFKEAQEKGPGDKITLTVKDITPKGWLLLVDPKAKNKADEYWKQIEEIENNISGRENDSLEYKSSFVYTADSEQNIDKQLGKEIMLQLAAFMNANGGTVCLGYKDDGSICGINNDMQYINSSEEDQFKEYKSTPDDLELKIRNTIKWKLGGIANSLTEVKILKNEQSKIVCHLIAHPSVKPIYLDRTHLYKRSGNMCQHLLGDEITFFILERFTQIMQNAQKAIGTQPQQTAELPVTADKTVEIEKDEKDLEIPVIDEIPVIEEKIQQYITLYKNGKVTRQTNKSAEPDVFFNIPFTASCKNKSSRLLFCYESGHVNVLNPGEIVSGKLKIPGKPYSNGFNVKDTLKAIFVCNADDYLVIRSKKNDGTEMIKAFQLKPYAVHGAMETPGNKVLDVSMAEVREFEIVRNEEYSFIHPIVVKSKNGALGAPASKFQNVVDFLEKRKNYSAAEDIRN